MMFYDDENRLGNPTMQPQELNLLKIFDAIMTEGSITRAAERLAMTQPAVSNAVSRMRTRWKDDLFVREGRTIQPTSYAINLWQQIRGPLQTLEQAVTPDDFDPTIARRTFRVCAMFDATIDAAWANLRSLIETEAPGINIHTFPYHDGEVESILMNAEVDMVVGAVPPLDNVIHSEQLFVPDYVCVMRPNHPLSWGELTLDKFAAADHLLVSSMSCETRDITDQALRHHGLQRNIAMTAHHFSAVPQIIGQSDLIAVLPSTAIEQAIFSGDLVVMTPPIDIQPTPVVSLWHKRQELDSGLIWLREHVSRLIKEHAGRHGVELEKLRSKTHKRAV